MRIVIFALTALLTVSSRAFCGEIIRTGLEIKDGNYFIDFEIRVDITKEQAMRIFNDSEKLKILSRVVKRVAVIEKNENDLVNYIRVVDFCLFGICMKTIQNNVPETGDSVIEIIIPDQSKFESSAMYLAILTDLGGKTIISCMLEAKPKIIVSTALVFVSKRMIENKLVDVGKKLIKKIESVAAENNNVVKEGK